MFSGKEEKENAKEPVFTVAPPPEKFISGSQESTEFKDCQLKDWYKRILSTYPVDFDTAQSFPMQALVGERGLIDCTVNVFAPIAVSGASTEAQKARHSRLLAQLREGIEFFIGAQDFINGPDDRYDYIKSLFATLRQNYSGYNKKDEAHLYLAWLALACVGGDVKALADMGSFFCAHYYVAENYTTTIDFSSCGEAFRLAEAIKRPLRFAEKPKLSSTHERARYCFDQAKRQAEIKAEDYDMEESHDFLYARIADVTYLVDAVAQFDEFYKDLISSEKLSSPRKYPNVKYPWGQNGVVMVSDTSVGYLLSDDNIFSAARDAMEDLLKKLQEKQHEDICLEKIINDYHNYIEQDFLTELPAMLVLSTAFFMKKIEKTLQKEKTAALPQEVRKKIEETDAKIADLFARCDGNEDALTEEEHNFVNVAHEDKPVVYQENVIDECFRMLGNIDDQVTKDKLFCLAKAHWCNRTQLQPSLSSERVICSSASIEVVNIFRAMLNFVQQKLIVGDSLRLENLLEELEAGPAGVISENNLFILSGFYHSFNDDNEEIRKTMPNVINRLSDQSLKNIAEKFPAEPWFESDSEWKESKLLWAGSGRIEGCFDLMTNRDNNFKHEAIAAWQGFNAALEAECEKRHLDVVRWEQPSSPVGRKAASTSERSASTASGGGKLVTSNSMGYFNDSAGASSATEKPRASSAGNMVAGANA